MVRFLWLIMLISQANYKLTEARMCSRHPTNTNTPKSPVDENYVISISGNPETYILGQEYNVSLNAYNGRRYISFMLALENENGENNFQDDLGHFEVTDSIDTRYSPNCINMVENTNTNPKTHSHVTWVAPSEPGTGCILIRATLLQHRDVWHMDDGGLTRRICEEITDDVESQPATAEDSPCCACDEARYELIFEGTWSRNLHPKDFPTQGWITRFGDIVGAAHTSDYRFWEYGALATEGMKQYAQYNTPQELEREFSENFRNGKIRTIIKARGPSYPNLNGKSVASVRVDPQHHLISFASKIEPSPDWIVGLSGLELCMANCTWLEQKVISLYPWDVGTDAGPSYTSPDQPQIPPDVIRRMRSDFPNDPRSPFYDVDGNPMKPMATLTVRRQRLYERLCEDEDSNNVDVQRECFTHPWSSWSECTSKCGEGRQHRSRVYKQPDIAKIFKCEVELREEQQCQGEQCGEAPRIYDEFEGFERQEENYNSRAECQISEWGPWSPCSRTCGEGRETRRREYINPSAESKCQNAHFVRLMESRTCSGRACLGSIGGGQQFGYEEDEEVDDNYGYNEANQRSYGNMDRRYGNEEQSESFPNNANNWRSRNNRYPVETQQNNYFGQTYDAQPNTEEEQPEENGGFEVGNLSRDTMDIAPQQKPNTIWRKPQKRYRTRPEPAKEVAEIITEPPLNRLEDVQKSQWQQIRVQRPTFESNYRSNRNEYDKFGTSGNDLPTRMPRFCFEQLRMVSCTDPTVVGNYWFYNYCEDECMLYAADVCDRNENKFTSLESCEQHCRQPEYGDYKRQRQNSPECQRSEARNLWRRPIRRRNSQHTQFG